MIVVTVILVFVAYVSAQPCLPDQWQATIVESSPFVPVALSRTYMNMSMDYINKRYRLDLEGGFSMLQLNEEGMVYEFDNSSCMKQPCGPWMFLQCLPKTANASKPYRVGWQQNITVTDYFWNEDALTSVLMSLTDNLVVKSLISLLSIFSGQWDLQRQNYREFVPHIVNPQTFDVPKVCMTADEAPADNKGKMIISALKGKTYTRD
ncbi:hypothetical protein ACF0H5_000568 [Mactra antiquata]